MNDHTIMWILGEAIFLSVGGVAAYVAIIQRVTRLEVRLEAFIDGVGKKSARGLHSPDDHLNLDVLLDKYLSRHYELTPGEWKELHDRCEVIIEGTNGATGNERSLAALLAAVCEHKLMGIKK